MNKLRYLTLVFTAALLSACAASAPTTGALAPSEVSAISVANDAAEIDISALGATTSGREAPSSLVADALEKNKTALELLSPGKAAKPIIRITDVSLITTGQTILIGGESIMKGTVSLLNAETGAVIVEPVAIEAGAGGYVLGGLVGVATRDSDQAEIDKMAAEFMQRARIALYGPNA